MKWLPNAMTISRGLMGPLIAWVLIVYQANFIAFWLFLAAIFTDLFDGWLAQKLDAQSALGAWLDPVCDKLLTDSVWLGLWTIGWAPRWLVATILCRDALVATGWYLAQRRGLQWQASRAGQFAITFEGIAVPVLLVHFRWLDIHWYSIGIILGGLTLALSAASAVGYLFNGPRPAPTRAMNPDHG